MTITDPKRCLRMNWRPLCVWKRFKTNSQIGSRTLTSVGSASQGRSWRIYCVLRGVIHVLSDLLPLPRLGLTVSGKCLAFLLQHSDPPEEGQQGSPSVPQRHGSPPVYIVWRAARAFSGIRSWGGERLQQSSYFFIEKCLS